MKTISSSICLFTLLILAASIANAQAQWPGETSDWKGFDCYDFQLQGRGCKVVAPHDAAQGSPWIWRARFWGHEPQLDVALLERGFHVVYMDVANLYGAPKAVELWNHFYNFLTDKGLSQRCVLEGMSRGGLIIYNWAAANPQRVACIYGDAPVCDVKSWPGGKGKSAGSPDDWQRCLEAYGLTETEMMAYDKNPIDNLEPLAKAVVPVLHVCGDADVGVPMDENTNILQERYKKLGGLIRVITKKGVGHHPHSLKDPAPIVDFILPYALSNSQPIYDLRDGLRFSSQKFHQQKQGRVVFLGGSITHNGGWRDHVCAALQERFPDTAFSFINAGIPSMGSTPGAFRLMRDVFADGPVDLLFVEAAVNDSVNGRIHQEPLRGMEGVIRHARRVQPDLDIVMMHFVDPGKIEEFRAGKTPRVIELHEQVADYYRVPSLNLAKEMTQRLDANEFTWEDDFKNLHPSPFGQRLYARSINALLDDAWRQKQAGAYSFPEKPLDTYSYSQGRLVDIANAEVDAKWEIVNTWKPTDGAGTRAGFVNEPMLVATEAGAELRFSFEGTGVGVFVAAGPDAGMIEYQIDGGAAQTLDLFTQWSGQLHLPWAYVLDSELAPGRHTLRVKVVEKKNPNSKGNAVRVRYFLVSEAP
ncbi:MAG: GDSL-type esterase/lipase family protein [Candidatus Hinthialibacter antarcticus]|nr:GDSL-type esterase/lipase family protein [Candidatus Hinthialibacter antarcticus]